MRAYRYLLIVVAALAIGLVLRATTPLHVDTGTWTSAGQMTTARAGAASVLLPDGRIMIIGGTDANGNPLATTEFFNPDGTFAAGPVMAVARTGHAAIWLWSGEVLVTGGTTSGGGATNSVETFDPLTNVWTTLPATLGDARSGHALAQLADGSVLVVGGENAGTPVTSLETYSLITSSFTFSGSMPSPRKDAAAAALPDGRVLIAGGSSTGADGNPVPLATTLIYDPTTGALTAGPAMSSARVRATATSTYDGVAVIGGNDGVNDLGTADIYSQWTNAFRSVSGAVPRSGHIAVLLPNNGGVLVTGGTGANAVDILQPWRNNKAGMFLANPSPNSTVANHDGGFVAPTGVTGLMLVAGGKGDVAASTDLYGFATIATDKSDYAPGTTVVMTGAGFQPGETVTLQLQEWVSSTTKSYPDYTVTADANGGFTFSQYAPTPSDLNSRFHLTAIGQTSGYQAQTVFTDGNITVSGTVRDNGGHAISGATVTCSSGCNASVSVTTATDGTYSFSGQHKLTFDTNGPVTLILTASASGYNSATQTLTNVNNGGDRTGVNFALTPAKTDQTITVTTPAPGTAAYNASFSVAATASSSLPVAITTTGGCSGNGTGSATIAMTSSTTSCVVHYNQAGNASYNAAPEVTSTTTATKAEQTVLTFTPGSPLTYNETETLSTGGGSGTGAVTYAITGGSCSIVNGNELKATSGTGTCAVTATKAADDNYNQATASANVQLQQADQTALTFTPGSPLTYNQSETLSTGGGSGTGAVTYAVTSGSCSIVNGDELKANSGTGTCAVTATKAADDNYNQATASADVTLQKATQTITVGTHGPSTAVYNTQFTVAATSNSGLDIAYSAAGVCSNTGATFTMTSGTGICTVKYDQAGNDNYNPATQVTESVTAEKADQATLTFAPGSPLTYNQAETLSTGGGSGTGSVTYAVTSGSCTIVNGNELKANSGTGSCAVTATKASDDNYKEATASATVTLQKADQTITVGTHAPATAVYNTQFTVAATSNSGLDVAYSAAGVCTNNGATFTMTSGTGTCTVKYDQAGNDNYNAATQVTESVTAEKADQAALIFTPSSPLTYNEIETLSTDGGSGTGAVTYAVTSGSCTIVNGNELKANSGTGSCAVTATKASDDNYKQATTSANVTLQKANQTITVGTHAPSTAVYNTQFTVAATSNSGLDVTYGAAGVCSNTGASFTMTSGTGTCTVKYDQVGNDNYNAATQITESVTAQKANQTIAIQTHAPTMAVYNAQFTVAATASSELAVSYSPVGVCTNNGATFTMTSGTGTCTVKYDQAGNDNYNAAIELTESVTAQKAGLTITPNSPTTIVLHTPATTFRGGVSSLAPLPQGANVQISITKMVSGTTVTVATQSATIQTDGSFSTSFDTSTLAIGSYGTAYSFAGNDNFNSASATGTLAVHYGQAIGFFQPWAAPPVAFKAGSTIPLKWQYVDALGNVVDSSDAAPSVVQVGVCLSTPSDTEVTIIAAGKSGYQYDSLTHTWQFNWNTSKGQVGCYQINVISPIADELANDAPTQLR